MPQDNIRLHCPEPGHRRRWLKQALGLLWRSPLALVAFAGLGLLSMTLPFMVTWALEQIDASERAVALIPALLRMPVLVGPAMLAIAIYRRTDRGDPVNLRHLFASILPVFVIVLLINGVVVLGIHFLSWDPSDQVVAATEPAVGSGKTEVGKLLFILLVLLSIQSTLLLVCCAAYSPLLLGGVVGFWMRPGKVRQIDRALRAHAYVLYAEMFAFILLFSICAFLLGPFGVLIHTYTLAWLYVAARELIGGISKNSGRETLDQAADDAEPKAD